MHLVFVHGWGFNAHIWRELRFFTQDTRTITLIDLGFVGGGPSEPEWPEGAIGVGHSLGFLWLLHHKNRHRFRGLVSIQGFDRFCPPIPRARVASMRRELARDPARMLAAFRRACGAQPSDMPKSFDTARLDEGLGWLADWDETASRAELACPLLSLASRDDAIVPPEMSSAIWGNDNVVWSETGGHVLPLARPEWCAQHVLDFAHDLEA